MMWKIEIKKKDNIEGENLRKDILDFGIQVERCGVIQVYYLFGGASSRQVSEREVERIAEDLLSDKVCETYEIIRSQKSEVRSYVAEVVYNPGVMDPVTASALKGIQDLGIKGIDEVKTAKKYIIWGELSQRELEFVCSKLLVNSTIQHIVEETKIKSQKSKVKSQKIEKPIYVEILASTLEGLIRMSKEQGLALNREELKSIQQYFKSIGRNPTDIELETIAQTWSEHCVHKTFKSKIEFNSKIIQPLLTTIMQTTDEIAQDFCVSVFKDNAGIIKFTDGYNVCFKVETHNHPSAIEPYGGAGTGIGGVIRDTLGTGLGAKPILNTDVFCFGPPDYPHNKLPKGTLHPLRIMKGVVAGVRDYGNKMGIPTANGAVLFDPGYVGNPVIYCGNVGLIPADKCKKETVPGDSIVLIGGRTGRDGIHGVTFASAELTEESETISSQAVQIGNPITEKKVTDVLLQLRDKELYRAITDCGGGGLSSAIGELARPYGAIIDLDKVPLKYEGLSYREIWISEAQERMIIFVPPKNIDKLLALCEEENVEATIIGEVTDNKSLVLRYQEVTVADLDMEFLHNGIPLPTKSAKWNLPKFNEPNELNEPRDLTPYLLKILGSLNVCSKKWIIRQYDHEVQGGSVIKPLVGLDGPGDACVIRPLLHSDYGVVASCGINPKYGKIDPYWMAASAVDEAIRNAVSVGADPDRLALLDNFSWGNPDKPEVLGQLVRAVEGCCMASKTYGTPFISGKDSLNNEYRVDECSVSIPPTLLVSAIGVIEDVNKTVTMDLKEAGDSIYILGETFNELGGSHYYEIQGFVGNSVPKLRPQLKPIKLLKRLHIAIKAGFIRACHDCSEGGIGVACAEMCFAGGMGMQVYLSKVKCGESILRDNWLLFSESNTRFIIEVAKGREIEFEKLMDGSDFSQIGITTVSPELEVFGLIEEVVAKANIYELKSAWQSPFKSKVNPETSSGQKSTLKQVQGKRPAIIHDSRPTTHDSRLTPRVLILRTAGTNCDKETKFAFELVGAKADLVHINRLIANKKMLHDYDILVIPGGFTYGDDISAGKILANELKFRLGEEITHFVEDKKLVLGICNGFQILAKLGLLPWGKIGESRQVGITLTNNISGVFQCEWIRLKVENSPCIFTQGMDEFDLPIAHVEGRFVTQESVIKELFQKNQVVLRYKDYNPNGSMSDIAGICDPTGRIFGLMPHPERFIFNTHPPNWTTPPVILNPSTVILNPDITVGVNSVKNPHGLLIFMNAVKYSSRARL